MAERIGFVSTRFAGSDGVSLESAKWAHVLQEHKHSVFWYAGRLDWPEESSFCVPEAFFAHPENEWINQRVWGRNMRPRLVTQRIRAVAEYLKDTLYEFVRRFDVSLLVVENALSIPMHLPLGLALTEFLAETRMPAIGHHHDFYWERSRFAVNAVHDLLDACFPPRDPNLRHVVINQAALEELSWRRGVPATLIPNVLDFERPPRRLPRQALRELRARLGLREDQVMILQPTRVIPRKGIEHAIQLVEMLGEDKYVLVVSHEAGDEGLEYRYTLSQAAHEAGVNLHFIVAEAKGIAEEAGLSFRTPEQKEQLRHRWKEGRFTLAEVYQCADLVTYP
ncbi:MAG TPA: glycosyltransferase family 1 protein, partial [Lentisphaerae bacterium]|nr:glycosyltransferase family 1 protein [Lentisphaerota bacterium]